jgi:signal transduction histidine kinase
VRLAFSYWGVLVGSVAVLLVVTVALWQGTSKSTVRVARSGGGSPLPGSRNPGGVSVVHSSDLWQLLIVAGIALAIIAGMSILFGWVVAGRFLLPIRTITKTAKEISATNLHERLNLTGPDDDLRELADTFDDLLARLERSFQFERRFVANASHELRTPLATMRVWLDVAVAKSGPVPEQTVALADRVRHELDRVDRLLESFLTLAQTQQGPAADESTLSLTEIVSAAVEGHADAIARSALNVNQQGCGQGLVAGSETLLSRMVDNVIDNAVNHNQPGGWVRIATETEGGVVRLVVENGGPRLDQADVDQLAQPFRRLGPERTTSDGSSGLGLSIVESIAEAYGGTLHLEALSDGGLRVIIGLPQALATTAGARM